MSKQPRTEYSPIDEAQYTEIRNKIMESIRDVSDAGSPIRTQDVMQSFITNTLEPLLIRLHKYTGLQDTFRKLSRSKNKGYYLIPEYLEISKSKCEALTFDNGGIQLEDRDKNITQDIIIGASQNGNRSQFYHLLTYGLLYNRLATDTVRYAVPIYRNTSGDNFVNQCFFNFSWNVSIFLDILHDFGTSNNGLNANLLFLRVNDFFNYVGFYAYYDLANPAPTSSSSRTSPANSFQKVLIFLINNTTIENKDQLINFVVSVFPDSFTNLSDQKDVINQINNHNQADKKRRSSPGFAINEDSVKRIVNFLVNFNGKEFKRPKEHLQNENNYIENYSKLSVYIKKPSGSLTLTGEESPVSADFYLIVDAVGSSSSGTDLMKLFGNYLSKTKNPGATYKVYYLDTTADRYDSASGSWVSKYLERGTIELDKHSQSNIFIKWDPYEKLVHELNVTIDNVIKHPDGYTTEKYSLVKFKYTDHHYNEFTKLEIVSISRKTFGDSAEFTNNMVPTRDDLPKSVSLELAKRKLTEYMKASRYNTVSASSASENYEEILFNMQRIIFMKTLGDLGKLAFGWITFGILSQLYTGIFLYLTFDESSAYIGTYFDIPLMLEKKTGTAVDERTSVNVNPDPYKFVFPYINIDNYNYTGLKSLLKQINPSASDGFIDTRIASMYGDYIILKTGPGDDLVGEYKGYLDNKGFTNADIIKMGITSLISDAIITREDTAEIKKDPGYFDKVITPRLTDIFTKNNITDYDGILNDLKTINRRTGNTERFLDQLNEFRRKITRFGKISGKGKMNFKFGKKRVKKFIQESVRRSKLKGTVGSFKSWCRSQRLTDSRGKVTMRCIAKAKKSGNKKLIKRATFAQNIKGYSRPKKNSFGGKHTCKKCKRQKKIPESIKDRAKRYHVRITKFVKGCGRVLKTVNKILKEIERAKRVYLMYKSHLK